MKKITVFLFSFLLLATSCEKHTIDASNSIAFRKSVNGMTSKLDTRQQVKFNEALYILKTFGGDEESYTMQMKNLMNMLDGKETKDVFALADQIAQQEGIDWSSTAPPSLGKMNVFDEISATEMDPNEILADEDLKIDIKSTAFDSVLGPKAIRVIPRLLKDGSRLYFKKATLPTTLEIYSGGKRLLKRKNLIQNSDFKGFYVTYAKLPYDKIKNDYIDILITIKASNKTYSTKRKEFRVNPKAFGKKMDLKTISYEDIPTDKSQQEKKKDSVNVTSDTKNTTTNTKVEQGNEKNQEKDTSSTDTSASENKESTKPKVSPKKTVQGFLSNLSAKNLKAAYQKSDNPNWGTYENFSNTNSGFGTVKNLKVKSIKTNKVDNTKATVDAVYDVEDKNGNKASLNVTFGLKNINGTWKISTYKIK